MLRELGDRSSAGQALSYVGRVHVAAGRLDEAIDTLRESVTILHEVGARLGEAEALDGLGRVYLELKRYDEALGAIEQSRTIYRQDGDRRGEALSTLQIGVTYLRAGNKAAARDIFSQRSPPWRNSALLRPVRPAPRSTWWTCTRKHYQAGNWQEVPASAVGHSHSPWLTP